MAECLRWRLAGEVLRAAAVCCGFCAGAAFLAVVLGVGAGVCLALGWRENPSILPLPWANCVGLEDVAGVGAGLSFAFFAEDLVVEFNNSPVRAS